jgi:phytoene dehydrogenase-like protein
MTNSYDCVIVGAGHNGLVCAADLAAAGWNVLVLERRDTVGGACVTEETWPGFQVSTASYVVSLLLPEIERDLDLARHGYKVLPRNPSSFTPTDDGRSLMLGPDSDANRQEIAKFSQADAEAFPRYEDLLRRIAERLEPVLTQTAPNLLPLPNSWRPQGFLSKIRDARSAWSLHQALGELGEDLPEAIELLTGAARPILDRWFESDVLKSTLATDAIIGTFQPISAPGTGYVLLHHVMGSAGGARGVWGYVEGGMGGLANAIAAAAIERGVEIRTGCTVETIQTHGDTVSGVLVDGTPIATQRVASNIDAHQTFRRLIAPSALPDGFIRAVDRIDYASASAKINLAVDQLPDFLCYPGHQDVGPQHRGTIHIGTGCEYLETAFEDARQGRISSRPIVEMTIPTSVDSTIAPPGHHLLSLFVQYAPYQLADGDWDDAARNLLLERCLAEIARYAPNVPGSVLHQQVLSPVDLESMFGLTGGNIFQGAMPINQLFNLRPVPGWADHRTPIRGLYLCGSASHPGGGVMGACGRNAAREMIRDGRKPIR